MPLNGALSYLSYSCTKMTAPSKLNSASQRDTTPSMSSATAGSPSANTSTARGDGITSAVPASTKSVPGRERKLSRQDRLDEIFETARNRKLMLDQTEEDEGPLSGRASHPNMNTGVRNGDKRKDTNAGKGQDVVESSADEETYVFRRREGEGMNYQSTAVQSGPGKRGGLKNIPSNTSIRRRGRTHDSSQAMDAEDDDEQESWWARMLSKYGSLELENKGSVARDHLALERTFLAWLRTSLAFASIGIAITQLFRLNTTSASTGGEDRYQHLRQMGKPLGATFLAISIVMLGVGFHRYFESQYWIIRGKFPASRGSIALVAAITFALSITSLVIIIVVEPGHVARK